MCDWFVPGDVRRWFHCWIVKLHWNKAAPCRSCDRFLYSSFLWSNTAWKKTQNIQQVLSQDNILPGFGLSPLCFFSFFDLPPEEGRKVTPACLFRYSFIYICPPLDCSFHTVMRLLANGKIQRADPLFFSFMISPANIFLHASETFRLCIKKKYEKEKKNRRLQLALPTLSSRHPAATTCTESPGFICHSCCLIGAVEGFTYGGKSCVNTHIHTQSPGRKKMHKTHLENRKKKLFGRSSSIHYHSSICHPSSSLSWSQSSSMSLPYYQSKFSHVQRQRCFLFHLPSLIFIFCLLWSSWQFSLQTFLFGPELPLIRQSVNMWELILSTEMKPKFPETFTAALVLPFPAALLSQVLQCRPTGPPAGDSTKSIQCGAPPSPLCTPVST